MYNLKFIFYGFFISSFMSFCFSNDNPFIIQDSSPQFINSTFTDNYGYNCSSSENCSSYYQCDQGWVFYVVGTSAFPHWKNSIIHGNGPTEIFLEGEVETEVVEQIQENMALI